MYVAIGLAVALVGVAGFFLLNRDKGGEVLLEAKAAPGPDPFTVAIESGAPPGSDAGAPPPPGTPPQGPVTDPPKVSVNVAGKSVGLYGGTNENFCDKQKLISFLQAEAAKATAFSSVLGIPTDQIASYVTGLTAAALQVDTRVTNHGFKGGKSTPRQSVLQAGTAVLVDAQGTPRVRCKCGNPLVPPQVSQSKPSYTGQAWPEFKPEALAAPPGTDLTPADGASGPPSQAGSGPDLVVNGSFESGISGWVESRSGGVSAQATVARNDAVDGSASLRIDNNSTVSPNVFISLAQRITVEAGASYCLRFHARSVSAQPGILSFTMDKDTSDRVGLPPGDRGWTQYARTFVAEAQNVELRMISENSGTVFVDAIKLNKSKCPLGA